MKATKGFSVSDWCGNFEVTFQGEQGIDWGGLRREWFELICSSLFDPRGGLFCTFHDKRSALVHPNPNRSPNLKLKYFEFAGKIVVSVETINDTNQVALKTRNISGKVFV